MTSENDEFFLSLKKKFSENTTSENSEVKTKSLHEILESYLGGELWLEEILPTGGLSIRPMQESDFQKSENQKKIMNREFDVVSDASLRGEKTSDYFPTETIMIEETPLSKQREQREENNGEPNELDVEIVMSQVPNVSADEVRTTLREMKNDIVDAIMKLTKTEQ